MSNEIAKLSDDDIIDRIAKEIGKSVAAHLEIQYPEATEGVAWNSCKRSIEGVVRNGIASAGKAAESGKAEEWLKTKRRERLDLAKAWREIRAREELK